MKFLDLAKMKKMSSDDKTTTFKHDDGHEIKIMHSALPRIQQEQIKRLPIHEMSKGGDVQEFDEGTPDSTIKSDSTDSSQAVPAGTHITINAAPAAPATPPAEAATTQDENKMVQQSGGQMPNLNQQVAPAPAAPTGAQPNLSNLKNAANVPAQAETNEKQALEQQKQIDIAKSQGQGNIAQQQWQDANSHQQRINDSINDMKYHVNDFANEMRSMYINPRAYTESMDSEQKKQTAMGLLLGGLGGGLTRTGGNVAMDYLNKQIDRDIDAQKARSDQAATIFGAYKHLYDDENIATNLTKVSMNDKIMADMNILANKLGTPQAEVNKQQALIKFQLENQKLLQESAAYANGPKYTTPEGQATGTAAHAPGVTAPSVGGHGNGAPAKPGQPPKYNQKQADADYAKGILPYKPALQRGSDTALNEMAMTTKLNPQMSAQYDAVQKQYNDAAQKDELRRQLPDIYRQLVDNRTPGGWADQNVAHGSFASALASLPLVGGPLGAAVSGIGAISGDIINAGKTASDKAQFYEKTGRMPKEGEIENQFEKERNYRTALANLGRIFSQLYPGVGAEVYGSKLSSVTPTIQDTPENIRTKMKAMDDEIRSKGEYQMLKDKGMYK